MAISTKLEKKEKLKNELKLGSRKSAIIPQRGMKTRLYLDI